MGNKRRGGRGAGEQVEEDERKEIYRGERMTKICRCLSSAKNTIIYFISLIFPTANLVKNCYYYHFR